MVNPLCPGCGLRLASGSLGTAPVDLCLTCSGVWLNIPALQELIQSGPAAVRGLLGQARPARADALGHPVAGGCPHCGGKMGLVAVPDVSNAPIFACSPCRGFWMTGSALEQLAAALDAPKQGVPPQEARTVDPAACPECGKDTHPSSAYCSACSPRLPNGAAHLSRT